MGYMKHSAAIVTAYVVDRQALAGPTPRSLGPVTQDQVVRALRGKLRELDISEYDLGVADLVAGPVRSVTNSYVSWALLPDGSKEGWATSQAGDHARRLFPGVLADAYTSAGWVFYPEAVEVHFGEDFGRECGPQVEAIGQERG